MSKAKHIEIMTDGNATQVFIEGKDMSAELVSVQVMLGVNEVPRMYLEYSCYDQMTISGEVEVIHICPKVARK